MFQSAISCKEYEEFVQLAKQSEEAALSAAIRYTNTTQDLLHDVINHIYHDGPAPNPPFSPAECRLQEAIMRGEYKEIFDEGHHKIGHF